MYNNYEKIKHMTIEQLIETMSYSNNDASLNDYKHQQIYKCIFNKNGIDYRGLTLLTPMLDEDDLSIILKYDKDYKLSFLLAVANKAYEDDITKQAIFLLKRHGLNYIIPLLPYVDEDEIREEYVKNKHS